MSKMLHNASMGLNPIKEVRKLLTARRDRVALGKEDDSSAAHELAKQIKSSRNVLLSWLAAAGLSVVAATFGSSQLGVTHRGSSAQVGRSAEIRGAITAANKSILSEEELSRTKSFLEKNPNGRRENRANIGLITEWVGELNGSDIFDAMSLEDINVLRRFLDEHGKVRLYHIFNQEDISNSSASVEDGKVEASDFDLVTILFSGLETDHKILGWVRDQGIPIYNPKDRAIYFPQIGGDSAFRLTGVMIALDDAFTHAQKGEVDYIDPSLRIDRADALESVVSDFLRILEAERKKPETVPELVEFFIKFRKTEGMLGEGNVFGADYCFVRTLLVMKKPQLKPIESLLLQIAADPTLLKY